MEKMKMMDVGMKASNLKDPRVYKVIENLPCKVDARMDKIKV